MTIERGVNVFAGVMVLVSLALTHWVSPYWAILTVFVGLNLFQSGITGWCPAEYILQAVGLKHSSCRPLSLDQ